jgi:hypothetical protein
VEQVEPSSARGVQEQIQQDLVSTALQAVVGRWITGTPLDLELVLQEDQEVELIVCSKSWIQVEQEIHPPVSPPQGNSGGTSAAFPNRNASGGGGAGSVGTGSTGPAAGGGGTGLANSLSGASVTYAGGGGGGGYGVAGGTGGGTTGTGGLGGGGTRGAPGTGVRQVQLIQEVEVDGGGTPGGPSGCRGGGNRRFRNRYSKRIKQGQWSVATESTI